MGVSACQVEGMKSVSVWTEAHHGWHVAKIRCSIGNKPKPEDDA